MSQFTWGRSPWFASNPETCYHEDMKPQAAFNALTRIRAGKANDAANAKPFVVRGVTKKGIGAVSTHYSGTPNRHETREGAKAEAERLAGLNPKSSFAHGEESEEKLSLAHGKDSVHAGKGESAANPDWDEGKHPRDENGKFA